MMEQRDQLALELELDTIVNDGVEGLAALELELDTIVNDGVEGLAALRARTGYNS